MHPGTIRHTVLVVTLVLAGAATGQEAVSRDPASGSASKDAGSVPASQAKPFEQIVRLWKAQLSEEFLLRKIEREKVAYRLSTDDVIACKAAGVPESIIEAMMKTDDRPAPSAEAVAPPAAVIPPVPPAPPTVPVVDVPPAVPAVPAPSLASRSDRSWDGIVRRSPGVVLFRSPWEPGKLSFLENEILWIDAGDAARNIVLPLTTIREQFLVCPKDASSDRECFEWGVKTVDAEFRFRDAAWQRGETSKLLELFSSLQASSPNLVSTKYHAKKG
jgi:hypothetical protein